jgi:hypothetical protein
VNAETNYDWNVNHWSVPVHLIVPSWCGLAGYAVSIGGTLWRCAKSLPNGPQKGEFHLSVPPFPW